jgi:hypothetical protein
MGGKTWELGLKPLQRLLVDKIEGGGLGRFSCLSLFKPA